MVLIDRNVRPFSNKGWGQTMDLKFSTLYPLFLQCLQSSMGNLCLTIGPALIEWDQDFPSNSKTLYSPIAVNPINRKVVTIINNCIVFGTEVLYSMSTEYEHKLLQLYLRCCSGVCVVRFSNAKTPTLELETVVQNLRHDSSVSVIEKFPNS